MLEKRRAQTGGGEVEKVDMPGKFNFYPKRPECPVWFFKEDVCFICSVYYGGRKAKKRSDKIEVFYNLFILVLTFIRSVTSQWTLILLSIRNTSHSIMLDSCHFDSDIETLSSVTSFRYILLSDIYFHRILEHEAEFRSQLYFAWLRLRLRFLRLDNRLAPPPPSPPFWL